MPTSYTTLLGLALPVTGENAGTWGDVVNEEITSLLDGAVAGTATLSTDADVTLTTTPGADNQARQAVILCTGARTAQRTITAPAASKLYTIINATTGGFSVKLVGAGPTTGVTIANGEKCAVAWNGSDFIKAAVQDGAGTFTQITSTVSTGTAPLVVASTTKVANLNVDQLDGGDWAAPGTIGSTTPNTGLFTSLSTTGNVNIGGIGSITNQALRITGGGLSGESQYGITASPLFTTAAVTQATALFAGVQFASGTFTTTDVRGVYVADTSSFGGVHTTTNQHGIYVADQTQGTNNYAIYTNKNTTTGTLNYNIYASGTAANYFAGNILARSTVAYGAENFTFNGTLFAGASGQAGTPAAITAANDGNQAVGRGAAIDILATGTGLAASGFRTGARLIGANSFAATQGTYFAVQTENTSGTLTERLRIDSAGDVGIGTATPREATVGWSSAVRILGIGGGAGTDLNSSYGALSLKNTRTTLGSTDVFGALSFESSASAGPAKAYITSYADGAGGATGGYGGSLRFSTRANDSATNPVERLRIDSSGAVLVGTTTTTNNVFLQTKINEVTVGDASLGGAVFTGYNGTSSPTARSPALLMQRSRGTTDQSLTAVASGDRLGIISFSGADGTAFTGSSNIAAFVDGTVSAGSVPSRIVISTSNIERFSISSAGVMTMAAPAGTGAYGHYITNASTLTSSYAALYVGNGTASNTTSLALATFGTAYTTAGAYVQDGSVVETGASLAGGLTLSANAGGMNFYTGGTAAANRRMTINNAGAVDITGTLTGATATATGYENVFYNTNAATNAYTAIGAGNAVGTSASLRVGALGTGWTTNGGYVQDGGFIDSGSALSGGLSIGAQAGGMRFYTGGYGDANLRMTLDNTGNLGLGVTPSAWGSSFKALDINTYSAIASTASQVAVATNAFFDTAWKYKTTAAAAIYQQAAGSHTWSTAPSGTAGNAITFTQAMTLDASGLLGLKTTPSAWNSTTAGVDFGQGGALVSQNSTTTIELVSNGYYSSPNWVAKNVGGLAFYRMTNGQHQWHCAGSVTAGGNYSPVQVLNVEKDKTLALQGNISVNGVGLTFPSTQVASADANTLDDYEEGTWTPVFADAAAAGNVATAATAVGRYTKIGNRVHWSATLLDINTTGLTAGNSAYVRGLPFVSANVSNTYNLGAAAGLNVATTSGSLTTSIGPNVASMVFVTQTTTSYTTLNVSAFTSGTADLYLSGTYETA